MNSIAAAPRSERIHLRRTAEFDASWSYRLTCIALLFWWTASLYPLMKATDVEQSVEQAADATAQGSLGHQLLVISFACLGACHLPRAVRALRAHRQAWRPLWLLGAYMLWSTATLCWSTDVSLSMRRLGMFVLLLIGTIGLGAGFYSRVRGGILCLGRHVVYAALIAIAVLIVSRASHFSDLLNPQWSLKANTAAESYMNPAAFGFVTALIVFDGMRIKQAISVSVFALVLVFLKGRTVNTAVLAAALIAVSRLGKRSVLKGLGFLAGVILMLFEIDLATGGSVFLSWVEFAAAKLSSILPYVTIGQGLEDLLSLDGRIELWQSLWPYFLDNRFIGHGFGAFWSPTRFDEIYAEAKWWAVAAHNGFLEELLGTGIIGLVLCLAFWFFAMRLALRFARQQPRAGYLVFSWLLLFLMLNSMGSILQFYYQTPTMFATTALFAMLACSRPAVAPEHRRAAPAR